MTARFSDLAAKRLALRAAEIGVSVDYEYIRADQLRIDFCRGCESCFREGVCPLDCHDDLGTLKQKMLEADVLLFCSPVYTGSLSGSAKAVIDRLGYWTHREELAGKTAAALVTTSHSHGDQTAEQLAHALRAMGAAVAYAGSVSRHFGPVNFYLPDQLEPELDKICEKLLDCRRDPAAYIREEQDRAFAALNQHFRQSRLFSELTETKPRRELLVWEERGFARYASLSGCIRENGPPEIFCWR